MRLIDAMEYRRVLEEEKAHAESIAIKEALEIAIADLGDAPTIEAEPVKHGRWIDHMVRDWRCSECGDKIHKVRNVDGYCYDDKPNYCPNCGCKMDLEEST